MRGRRDIMPLRIVLATDGTAAPTRTISHAFACSIAPLAMAVAPCAASVPPPARCASTVVAYVPGTGAGSAYQQPASALGEPSRFTGVGIEPGAVTPFRPPFLPTEVVSIGRGGHLVLAFADPVQDDPRNPYGIDLVVYGNAFCADLAFPAGVAGWTYAEGGIVDVSDDGSRWHTVGGAVADGGLPTLAWSDCAPYSTEPGTVPTAFDRPVDPALTADSVLGMPWPELVAAYGGGAGGTGIDLAGIGLASIRFVRIRVPADAPSIPEVDAVVAVRPAPAPSDLDGDGAVSGSDLGLLLGAWGPCQACTADLDGDGSVSGSDLGLLLGAWG
jgi:hypothetical protein